ncbi:hypothetical protein [Blastochloris tepida]|uniref:Uncharacterized protein n=1 Tax=Blastochloris tepida TaxID=2233851 RepID=A0A348FYD1_9HYPH|nr:hypothetical protein [Blastochloris tepida]BBF92314.1 hypothetical protein BLTE_09990 [Blastochloris tepida]
MADDNKSNRDGAGKPGLMQYELDARTLREKTERLKALRLARAAAEPAADSKPVRVRTAGTTAAATKGAKRTTAKSGKASKSSSSLSDWLKDQEALGRKP